MYCSSEDYSYPVTDRSLDNLLEILQANRFRSNYSAFRAYTLDRFLRFTSYYSFTEKLKTISILAEKSITDSKRIHSTISRLSYIQSLLSMRSHGMRGIILGGSMSYGRFYSVYDKENHRSDIDLLIVFDGDLENVFSQAWCEFLGLEKTNKWIASANDFFRNDLIDIGAYHFQVPEHSFEVSLTLVPSTKLNDVFLVSPLGGDYAKKHLRFMTDRRFASTKIVLSDFEGNPHAFEVTGCAADDLTIYSIPACVSSEEYWVPNGFQNFAAPLFEILYDADGTVNSTLQQLQGLYADHEAFLFKRGVESCFLNSHIRFHRMNPWIVGECRTLKRSPNLGLVAA